MSKKIISAVILFASLSGCATVSVAPSSLPSLKDGQSPAIGQTSSVRIGEAIFKDFRYYATRGAITKQSFSHSGFAEFANVPASSNLASMRIDNDEAYCTRGAAYKNISTAFPLCFTDRNADSIFDTAYILGPNGIGQWRSDIMIPYEVGEQVADAGGFRYEILYQGVSSGTLRLTYREFTDNFIRPAFQQDLTYTLNRGRPTEVSFRSARFIINSADNNSISYRVLSGLRQ